MDRNRQPADFNDEWAWAFVYEINGELIPAVGELVDDLREKDFIEAYGYHITMEKNRFLTRRRVE